MDKKGLLSKLKQKNGAGKGPQGRPANQTQGKGGFGGKGKPGRPGRGQNDDDREAGKGKPLRKNIDYDSEDS